MHMESLDNSYCTALSIRKDSDDMTMEEFKKISPVFEEDIYDAISMKTCVEMRKTIGAPGKSGNGESDRNRRSLSCDRVMDNHSEQK